MWNRKRGEIVRIKWQDPETDSGWFEADDFPELDIAETVGIFLKETDTTLWLASTYHDGTKQFADRMAFPKGCILNVETIS